MNNINKIVFKKNRRFIKMIFNDLDKMSNLSAKSRFIEKDNFWDTKRFICYQNIKKKYLNIK